MGINTDIPTNQLPIDFFVINKINDVVGLQLIDEEHRERSEVTAILTAYLLRLMQENLPKFYQFLYQIDVNEIKVREMFKREIYVEKIAFAIAGLVLQRLEEKYFTRQKYNGA